jgi:hypothetical protein
MIDEIGLDIIDSILKDVEDTWITQEGQNTICACMSLYNRYAWPSSPGLRETLVVVVSKMVILRNSGACEVVLLL